QRLAAQAAERPGDRGAAQRGEERPHQRLARGGVADEPREHERLLPRAGGGTSKRRTQLAVRHRHRTREDVARGRGARLRDGEIAWSGELRRHAAAQPCAFSGRTEVRGRSSDVSVIMMGGACSARISGRGGAVVLAMRSASSIERAVSQPRSLGMYSLSAPTTIIRPRCWRPASPQYHMKNGCAGWYALPTRY